MIFVLKLWQLWFEKFQYKTNGVTPRRWTRFCNPSLSKIDWTCIEDWVLNTEKLAELRKVVLVESFLYVSEHILTMCSWSCDRSEIYLHTLLGLWMTSVDMTWQILWAINYLCCTYLLKCFFIEKNCQIASCSFLSSMSC